MESAKLDLFSNFHFRNFLVRDLRNDTLLFVPDLTIKPSAFTLTSRFVEISEVVLKDPLINFYIDSTNVINLQFIVQKLSSTDTTKKAGWLVSFREISIINGHFKLKHAISAKKEYGINFTDLDLNPLNINVKGLRNTDNGIEIKIKDFNFVEKTGFVLNNLSARMRLNRENMVFNNLELETPNSFLDANQVRLNFTEWKDLGAQGILKKVKFTLDMNRSDIHTNDLAYFVPAFRNFNLNVGVNGLIKGPINDLKGKNLEIWYGIQTYMKSNFDISGLPDISNSFIHVDIKNFTTNPGDIENFYIPGIMKKPIRLSSDIKQISWLKYKGKFTGFISDFVAYGTFTSNMGVIESDLSLKPDSSYAFVFNGKVKTHQFKLGKLLKQEGKIGDISLNAFAKGKFSRKEDFSVDINGIVQSFVVNRYNYQNMQVKGLITKKTFEGNLVINDPNVDLSFNGNVNFENPKPIFNFIANVKNINLYKLHFDNKDSSSSMSFYATANFEGDNIDNAKGELKLWNSTFKKTGKEIHVNDFLLFTQTINDTNRIVMRSSFADAEVWGVYKFKELAESFKMLAKPYFPSLITGAISDSAISNNIKFDIDFKDSRDVSDFIVPDLYISKDAKLTGAFNAKQRALNFHFSVPLLQLKTQKWYNVYFDGKANKDSLSIISGCKNLKLSNQLNFENFTILSSFKKDSMDITLRWNNWDTLAYKGNFSFTGSVNKLNMFSKPIFDFKLKPSQLILKDTAWKVVAGRIKADSSGLLIDKFTLSYKNQNVNASGKISNIKDDHLVIEISNMNLDHLKTIYTPKKIDIVGIVSGKAHLSNLLSSPQFEASFSVDSLSINKQNIGHTELKADWDPTKKNINIEATSYRGPMQILNAKGNFNPNSKTLDFTVYLNKLRLDIFEPFLSGIFSNVHGVASGTLTLTGTASSPILNGDINAQKATFMVNYLKTRYNFTHPIAIRNNTLKFQNIEVFDSKSNKAYVNGTIEFEKFRDVHLDLKIDAQNFECLNTTDKESSIYYGNGYATGFVTIKGTAPVIQMDITATTNKNTAIFIPLLLKSDLMESSFIRIVQKEKKEDPFAKYEIDASDTKQELKSLNPAFKLNLNLNVTPDAEVQLVFDKKIGDFIQGNGSGKFSIFIEGGRFSMYGVYTLDKGKYMFTLQNIINKKFEVNPGSTITWNGDPLDAIINLEAQYAVKVPLYDLLAEQNEEYKKRIPVDCKLWLTEKLLNPAIKYDIYLPSSDQVTRTKVETAINTDDKKSLQFLSLLVLNSFVPPEPTSGAPGQESSFAGLSAAGAGATGMEFLSNQFSHWLSQISNDFDIGINYHPGDEITKQEVEVIMSYSTLNDRIILNGNVDVGVDNQNTKVTNNKTNNIVGDFNLEYKFTDNGKVRLKVFNRSNDSYFEEKSSPYTQGLGIFYKEDFNSFDQLFRNYYRNFKSKKSKEKTKKESENLQFKTQEFSSDTIPKISEVIPMNN